MSNARVQRPTGVIDVMVHNRICLSGFRRGAIVRQSFAAQNIPSITPSHISDKALQQKVFQALQQKVFQALQQKIFQAILQQKVFRSIPIQCNPILNQIK